MSMVVLVTGSRTFTDSMTIREVLGDYRQPGNVLMHGACPDGADKIAADIWQEFGLADDPHPADWKRYRGRAGFVRNAEMVARKPDEVVAFIDACTDKRCKHIGQHGSHGATHTAGLAERAGILVRYVKTPALIAAEEQRAKP